MDRTVLDEILAYIKEVWAISSSEYQYQYVTGTMTANNKTITTTTVVNTTNNNNTMEDAVSNAVQMLFVNAVSGTANRTNHLQVNNSDIVTSPSQTPPPSAAAVILKQAPIDEKHYFQDMNACFTAFDKDGDGLLNIDEFHTICRALFRNEKGVIYELEQSKLMQIFDVFDKNGDGFIDRDEFIFCWNHWIKVIVHPVSVFLIVDVQNDFISGTLNISKCSAQQNGLDVIEPINRLLNTVEFDAVFYSLDWHPNDHVSFIDNVAQREIHSTSPVTAENAKVYDTVIFAGNPPMKQRLWPKHCVQDSWGAELHEDLKVVENAVKVYKGTNPEVDSYSVFWDNKKLTDTTLCAQLRLKNATDIYICGLAYDVCVGATAVDALAIGYRTILLDDCSRGVDLLDIEKTKNTVIKNNGVIVHSNEVKAMVEGRDRRKELGYKLAMELKMATETYQQQQS